LDNFITDDSVVQLLELTFKNNNEKKFYEAYPDARDAAFVPPYPEIACKELGYPKVKIEKEHQTATSGDQEMPGRAEPSTNNMPTNSVLGTDKDPIILDGDSSTDDSVDTTNDALALYLPV